MNKHKGVNGLRVWVHKPTRDGYTTISLTEPLLAKLMRLSYNDLRHLTRAAREVSWKLGVAPGEVWNEQQVWSAVVANGLYNKLRGSFNPEEAAIRERHARERADLEDLRKVAEENNRAWQDMAKL